MANPPFLLICLLGPPQALGFDLQGARAMVRLYINSPVPIYKFRTWGFRVSISCHQGLRIGL